MRVGQTVQMEEGASRRLIDVTIVRRPRFLHRSYRVRTADGREIDVHWRRLSESLARV